MNDWIHTSKKYRQPKMLLLKETAGAVSAIRDYSVKPYLIKMYG